MQPGTKHQALYGRILLDTSGLFLSFFFFFGGGVTERVSTSGGCLMGRDTGAHGCVRRSNSLAMCLNLGETDAKHYDNGWMCLACTKRVRTNLSCFQRSFVVAFSCKKYPSIRPFLRVGAPVGNDVANTQLTAKARKPDDRLLL